MNKTEFVAKVAETSGRSKSDVDELLGVFLDTIKNTLKSGEDVIFTGFGTFKVSERAARQGRNPKTGETISIEAAKLPSFKAGKSLKDACN